MRELLCGADRDILIEPHGKVLLWQDPSALESIFVDFELHAHDVPQWTFDETSGPTISRTANWLESTKGPFTRGRVANLICGRALAPLADVLCYFTPDFGSIKAVAAQLAAQLMEVPPSDLPFECLPRVLVVVNTNAKSFDCASTESAIVDAIAHHLSLELTSEAASSVQATLRLYFNQIRVIGIPKAGSARECSRILQKRLQLLRREAATAKKRCGYLFARDHAYTFAGKLLDHFSSNYETPLSFVKASRPLEFSLRDFPAHLTELFSILPSEAWLWHLACPLITSAIMFCSYPKDSHSTFKDCLPTFFLLKRSNRISDRPHSESTI